MRAVPGEWIDGLVDWPRSVGWLRRHAAALDGTGRPPAMIWPAAVFRNIVFFAIVVLHGLRRMVTRTVDWTKTGP